MIAHARAEAVLVAADAAMRERLVLHVHAIHGALHARAPTAFGAEVRGRRERVDPRPTGRLGRASARHRSTSPNGGTRRRRPYCSASADRLGRPRDKVGCAMQGKVKFFDNDRGFGFISREGGEDVFVHVSNLRAGSTTLAEGQTVEFEVGPGRKSEEAKDVRSV